MHAQRINPIKPATPAATGTGVTLDGVVRDKEGRPLKLDHTGFTHF